jgi:hypothetical protein
MMEDMPFFGIRDRVFKEIVAQMRQRSADLSESWNRFSSAELGVEQRISKIALEELGWPNDHFLPSDPFEIIMWDGTGDLATASAIDRMERELGLRRRSDGEWQELASLTFGDVVQKIAAELDKDKQAGK